MSVLSPFLLKGSLLPGDGPQIHRLIEVSCRRPTGDAFAIVLDLSDSSGVMRDEASKLARLVRRFPRNMPVWLYRMSSHVPATNRPYSIADFHDGTIELGDWLDNASERHFMANRGSLFRPVVEAIAQRKTQEGVSEVRIIVLTDGELLDVGELHPPEGITILGLTNSSSDSKCRHWRRVLPACPIFELQDPGLDRFFEGITPSFYGACNLTWRTSEASSTVKIVNLASGQITLLTGNPIMWNFADQSLLCVWSLAEHHNESLQMTCCSLKSHQEFNLIVPTEMEPLNDSVVAATMAILNADGATHANVLLDVRMGDPNFESVRAQFLAAKVLTEKRRPWLDASGVLQVWNDDLIAGVDGLSKFDALVCLGRLPNDRLEDTRFVVFALEKRLRPAFAIGKGPFFDIAESSTATTISFDIREGRWMLSRNGKIRELDPQNSQSLDLPLVSKKDAPLVALFSGPLR